MVRTMATRGTPAEREKNTCKVESEKTKNERTEHATPNEVWQLAHFDWKSRKKFDLNF